MLGCGKSGVAKGLLHHALGVIKGAWYRNDEDVGRAGAGHLALLKGGHPALGIEDENVDAFLPHAAVNGGGTCVPRGGAQHGQAVARVRDLALVEQPQQL